MIFRDLTIRVRLFAGGFRSPFSDELIDNTLRKHAAIGRADQRPHLRSRPIRIWLGGSFAQGVGNHHADLLLHAAAGLGGAYAECGVNFVGEIADRERSHRAVYHFASNAVNASIAIAGAAGGFQGTARISALRIDDFADGGAIAIIEKVGGVARHEGVAHARAILETHI